MLLTVVLILVFAFGSVSILTRTYRMGLKPINFSTVVDIPAGKVELVYEEVRDALPSFMQEFNRVDPDGTLVTIGQVPGSEGSSKPLFTQRCERIGGTDLCPIYRLVELNGEPYAGSESHYAVSAFAPFGEKTVLTVEEQASGQSLLKFLQMCFVMKRLLAAQVRKLKQLTDEEVNGPRKTVSVSKPSSNSLFNPAVSAHQTVHSESKVDEPPKAVWAPGSAGSSTVARREKVFFERHKNELILSILAVGSFMYMFGVEGGLLLAPLILLHEYGHLLGFQLTGQKGNRLMLVPFFGGLAIANEVHKTEFNRAFCALMGPGICAPVSVALAFAAVSVGDHWSWWWLSYAAMLCGMGNALNMVPMMPFDGGHIMQSVARSLSRGQAHLAMMVMSAGGGYILMQAGYENFAYITFAWLATTMFQSDLETSKPTDLDLKGGLTIAAMYGVVLACHVGTALFIYGRFY